MNTSSPAVATAAAAAGSSSSRRSSWKNEVFLSFRGEDTRTGFTDHLLKALRDAGINTFIDDELKRGENIQRELDREIEGSRIAVVVFSKSYAESRWCLRELAKIMREGKVVYPIFYNVDPSQLRAQSSSLGEAFQNEDPIEVEQWRRDLKACADLSGRTFKTTAGGREGLFIQNVVGDIIALTKTRVVQTSQSTTLEYLLAWARVPNYFYIFQVGFADVIQCTTSSIFFFALFFLISLHDVSQEFRTTLSFSFPWKIPYL